MELISGIRTFLVNNIPKIVIKYNRDAKKNETVESRKAADIYMSARNGTDSWITYPEFNREMILAAAAMIPVELTETEIKDFIRNKDFILTKFSAHRDKFVTAAREWTLHNYEEKNEYYRMISGLPPVGAPDLYFDDSVYEEYEIERVPIHKVHQSVLISMDLEGRLDKFQALYPSYKYISHLGNGRIDVGVARMADNFDILYIPKKIDNDSYQRDFLRSYDQAKEYIMTVVYNMYYSSKYEYYDNYLAFITLMMAVQNLINNVYKIVVNRDFYDLESIRIFLTAYNVPYSGFFSLYQNKLLVKNLNILLQEKSTTRVLIDVMDLLGFTDYELVKYYLVKRHKTNINGMPILKYLKDENGNYILDEKGDKIIDSESVYEFYFSGIPIESDDVQQDILNSDFVVDYDDMIKDDNLWVDDATTKQLLMETDFNYMQTKYIDVKVVYRLQEIIFETVYMSRMILDNAKETKRIKVTMNVLSDAPVSLFDGIITLICLMCKMHGMEPTLLSNLSEVAYIMGFNFDADFDAIKADIMYNRVAKRKGGDEYIKVIDLYNSNIAKYITKTTFTTPEDVNKMYVNIRELKKLLVRGMADSDNLVVYNAYKRLYDSLMFTEVNNTIYNLSNGKTPDTFDEYLKESNYELYDLYMSCEPEMVPEYIEYITQRLSVIFTDTEYFPYIKLLSGEDIDALLKLLRFFKSYTVNIRKAHINLLLDDRYDNMMHVINAMKLKVKMKMGQDVKMYDVIDGMHNLIKMSDTSFEALDKIAMLVHNFMMKDYAVGIHKPKFDELVKPNDPIRIIDVAKETAHFDVNHERYTANDDANMLEGLHNTYHVSGKDSADVIVRSRFKDEIESGDFVNESAELNPKEHIHGDEYINMTQKIGMYDDFNTKDSASMHHIFRFKDESESIDAAIADCDMSIPDNIYGMESVNMNGSMNYKSSMAVNVTHEINSTIMPIEHKHGSDSITLMKKISESMSDKLSVGETLRFIYRD